MDKNLNSRSKLPWWMVLIQVSPLIMQLAGEVIFRLQGLSFFDDNSDDQSDHSVPPPLDEREE